MHINEDLDRLLVILKFDRVYLFRRDVLNNNLEWKIIRQIIDYPFYFDHDKTPDELE